MDRRPIPRSDLQVSLLCLGTMTFATPGITSAILGVKRPEQLAAALQALI